MLPVSLYFSGLARPMSLLTSSDFILGLTALVVASVAARPAFLSAVVLRNRQVTALLLPCRTGGNLLMRPLHLALSRIT